MPDLTAGVLMGLQRIDHRVQAVGVASTPPLDAPLWPVQRQGGQFLICVKGGPLSTVCGACAGPGERYSDVILRRAANQTRSDMSEVPKTPNPEQPGRILEEHLHDGLAIDGEPPLSPDERRRRVVRLCCSFMHTLACHRAGLHAGVKSKLLNPNHPRSGSYPADHYLPR